MYKNLSIAVLKYVHYPYCPNVFCLRNVLYALMEKQRITAGMITKMIIIIIIIITIVVVIMTIKNNINNDNDDDNRGDKDDKTNNS